MPGRGPGTRRRPPHPSGRSPMKVVMSLYPAPSGEVSLELLGCAENALGLRGWLEDEGHEVVSTSAREGSELEDELADANVLVTTPFWPVYLDRDLLEKSPALELVLTAGV